MGRNLLRVLNKSSYEVASQILAYRRGHPPGDKGVLLYKIARILGAKPQGPLSLEGSAKLYRILRGEAGGSYYGTIKGYLFPQDPSPIEAMEELVTNGTNLPKELRPYLVWVFKTLKNLGILFKPFHTSGGSSLYWNALSDAVKKLDGHYVIFLLKIAPDEYLKEDPVGILGTTVFEVFDYGNKVKKGLKDRKDLLKIIKILEIFLKRDFGTREAYPDFKKIYQGIKETLKEYPNKIVEEYIEDSLGALEES